MERITTLIQNRDLSGLEIFLKAHPETVYELNDQGLSPLVIAAYYQFPEAVALIVSLKAGLTFFEAVVAGDPGQVKAHLETEPGLVNHYSPDGFTALGLAIFFGKKDIAEYLLGKNAEVNATSKNEMQVAPIHSATAINRTDLVELLLLHGANPELSQQKGIKPIHSAAHKGNIDIVRLLIKYGASANPADNNGKTAADYAGENGYQQIVKLIIENENK